MRGETGWRKPSPVSSGESYGLEDIVSNYVTMGIYVMFAYGNHCLGMKSFVWCIQKGYLRTFVLGNVA